MLSILQSKTKYRNTRMNNEDKYVLFVDSHHGQYIPELFCKGYVNGNYKFTFSEQSTIDAIREIAKCGVGCEHYWDLWNDILNGTIIPNQDLGIPGSYYLHHDEDLWLAHESVEFDDMGYPILD